MLEVIRTCLVKVNSSFQMLSDSVLPPPNWVDWREQIVELHRRANVLTLVGTIASVCDTKVVCEAALCSPLRKIDGCN